MIPDRQKWDAQMTMLINRVRKNQRRLKSWRKTKQVTCYRLYQMDIPEIPLLIDWYNDRLHVGVKIKKGQGGELEDAWVKHLCHGLAIALRVPLIDVFIKYRRRGRGGTQYAPMGEARRIFQVQEGGYLFTVNLSDYLDTGLFLDHRMTRQMVAAESAGKRMLNLFAYTGSFSVYAAGGGAMATTTVDLSNTYLDAARQNMAQNGFEGPSHKYLRGDIMQLLKEGGIPGVYDLVVLDPPTTSKSKAMQGDLQIQRDYVFMLNAVLDKVLSGGVVYFSCNLSRFQFDSQAVGSATVADITPETVPPDFAGSKPHKCFRLVKN